MTISFFNYAIKWDGLGSLMILLALVLQQSTDLKSEGRDSQSLRARNKNICFVSIEL